MGGLIDKEKNVSNTEEDLFTFLITPALIHPDSLFDQIKYILEAWIALLSDEIKKLTSKSNRLLY